MIEDRRVGRRVETCGKLVERRRFGGVGGAIEKFFGKKVGYSRW